TRGTGLSKLGHQVVEECNKNNVLIDVSHLNVHGFEDVIEHGKYVFASHSNARSIQDHPRNLYDEQIVKLINKGGMINIVFCPDFVADGEVTKSGQKTILIIPPLLISLTICND